MTGAGAVTGVGVVTGAVSGAGAGAGAGAVAGVGAVTDAVESLSAFELDGSTGAKNPGDDDPCA